MSNTVLTREQFERCAPKGAAKSLTDEMLHNINTLITDPIMQEEYRNNLLGYASVLQDGKFKLQDYCYAVKFVSYQMLGDTLIKCYAKTFPDKYQRLVSKGTPDKNIQSYATMYGKGKLVNLIREQAVVPFHIYNQDYRQKALLTQVRLMNTAKSEKVQSDAANSVLTHTKGPETAKLEIDMSVKQDSSIDELRIATQKLVAQQELAISTGSSTAKDIAHSQIIEGEVINE